MFAQVYYCCFSKIIFRRTPAAPQNKIEEGYSKPGADPGILVRGAGRGPDQPTSETYILKSFFLQIRLLLDTLNLDF